MSDDVVAGAEQDDGARWEYRVIYVELPRIMRQAGADRLTKVLGEWSQDRWEPQQALEVSSGGDILQFYVHLRRRLPQR